MSEQPRLNDTFEHYILAVVVRTEREGISASKVDTYQFLENADTWGFPKHPGRTAILPPETDLVVALRLFIALNTSLLAADDAYLGTWIHPYTGEYYFDITTSKDELEEARRVAQEYSSREGRQIVALYNAYRRETVYLNPVDVQ